MEFQWAQYGVETSSDSLPSTSQCCHSSVHDLRRILSDQDLNKHTSQHTALSNLFCCHFAAQVMWLIVTEVRSDKLRAGYRALSLQRMLYLRMLLLCYTSCIFHRQVWHRALSLRMRVLCGYSTFGHHPPLGYPCAKFRLSHRPLLS